MRASIEGIQKNISYNSLSIEPIEHLHSPKIAEIWQSQYREAIAAISVTPTSWLTNRSAFQAFVIEHIDAKKGVIAKSGEEIVGYMLYDNFVFHGEKTVFCPIIGHAALTPYKTIVYKKMYQYLSKRWIEMHYLNHFITFFAHDVVLQTQLFHLGFGLYVIDAFRTVDAIDANESNVTIIRATMGNIDDVMRLGEESRDFYRQAPLFLVRAPQNIDYYSALIPKAEGVPELAREKRSEHNETGEVFLAYVNNQAVGFMDIRQNTDEDIITLSDKSTGMIDGAYIRPEHRGRGIGKRLLQRCIDMVSGTKVDPYPC
jgi:predicted acetyltransferase